MFSSNATEADYYTHESLSVLENPAEYLDAEQFKMEGCAPTWIDEPEWIKRAERNKYNAIRLYNEAKYVQVVEYFDSLKTSLRCMDLTNYKLAYESCKKLASSNKSDSSVYMAMLEDIDSEIHNWFGKGYLDRHWNQITFEGPEEIFTIVEDQPEFMGGMQAFYDFTERSIRTMRIKGNGRVYVEFTVGKDGSVSNIRVVKGLDNELDKAAVIIMEKCPNWIPGMQRGRPVNVKMVMPIYF